MKERLLWKLRERINGELACLYSQVSYVVLSFLASSQPQTSEPNATQVQGSERAQERH